MSSTNENSRGKIYDDSVVVEAFTLGSTLLSQNLFGNRTCAVRESVKVDRRSGEDVRAGCAPSFSLVMYHRLCSRRRTLEGNTSLERTWCTKFTSISFESNRGQAHEFGQVIDRVARRVNRFLQPGISSIPRQLHTIWRRQTRHKTKLSEPRTDTFQTTTVDGDKT